MNKLATIAMKDHTEPIGGLILGLILTPLAILYLGDNVVSRIGFSLAGATFIIVSALTLSGLLRNNGRVQGILYTILFSLAGVMVLLNGYEAGIGFIFVGIFSALKAYVAKQ